MDDRVAAGIYKALGDATRLRIYNFLRTCCGPVALDATGAARPVHGPTVGEVCCHVTGGEKITSTLSFHLKELRNVGLITMERSGRKMICGVHPETLAALSAYFGNDPAIVSDCSDGPDARQ